MMGQAFDDNSFSIGKTPLVKLHRIVPGARGIGLVELKTSLAAFPRDKRRKLTIEAVLIRDLNDSPAEARVLARFASGLPAIVNLIPINPFPESSLQPPDPETVLAFQEIIKAKGIETFIRKSRGQDILAACGQLRN